MKLDKHTMNIFKDFAKKFPHMTVTEFVQLSQFYETWQFKQTVEESKCQKEEPQVSIEPLKIYTVIMDDSKNESGYYTAHVKELPGVITQCSTQKEIKVRIREALSTWFGISYTGALIYTNQ